MSTLEEVAVEWDAMATSYNNMWMLITGFLVFWMHAGFTMLEAGSVRHRNAVNILYKNLATISLGSFWFYLLGYGFAYGGDNYQTATFDFIGNGNYALSADSIGGMAGFFFQAMFAATAATIVSGAVAGRVALPAYFLIASWLTAFVYPVVVHWIWATGGWASAFQAPDDGYTPLFVDDGGCGVIDYAGSGVVHLTGGVAAFVVALILGPRLGRWSGDEEEFAANNLSLCTLGTFILWFGWYGFNCGSTLAFDGDNAGHVAVTTTLAPAAAAIVGMIVNRLVTGKYQLGNVLNCTLAGLVSITAGCSTLEPGFAIVAGGIGALVYMGSSKLMKIIGVDDPVDAISVHGAAGVWGLLAVGCFASEERIYLAYSSLECNGASGTQIATQLAGAAAIIAWVAATTAPLAIVLKVTGKLRVSEEMETAGLDASEHGGKVFAYIPEDDKAL
ncbi:Ammonium transporter 1 member 1 [Hondaea fermentalgiana]|uniref:Ammonium transporter n=1 Tax=Hondaea fermentalgiana TaxID=2315210 RepID=A0A2R5GV45_9STRA|nr:Ammonium transporter 1 member 1 [Hondaea fermentalgiana]|eukprot:GBG34720.1 Ammonium transporter 1 member 1 [Hondaea fermentalgiana]